MPHRGLVSGRAAARQAQRQVVGLARHTHASVVGVGARQPVHDLLGRRAPLQLGLDRPAQRRAGREYRRPGPPRVVSRRSLGLPARYWAGSPLRATAREAAVCARPSRTARTRYESPAASRHTTSSRSAAVGRGARPCVSGSAGHRLDAGCSGARRCAATLRAATAFRAPPAGRATTRLAPTRPSPASAGPLGDPRGGASTSWPQEEFWYTCGCSRCRCHNSSPARSGSTNRDYSARPAETTDF